MGVGQAHRLAHLFLDRSVDVDTIGDGRRQRTELLRVEALIALLVGEEKHDATAPLLQLLALSRDVAHRMVGRLLTGTQDGHDVVATSGGRQEAGHLATLRQLELILGIEVADHLDLILALPHL